MASNRRRSYPGARALVVILVLLAVAAFVGSRVFVVRSIDVEGNRILSADIVVAASGIRIGDSMFTVDQKNVRAGIDANRYLTFVSLWRSFPNRIILRVAERAPRAVLTWGGTLYMLDEAGRVLEKTAQIDFDLPVPVITGMQVRSAVVGQPIEFDVVGQDGAVQAVFDEAQNQQMLGMISELNVASLDNLYLVTFDGLQINIGTATDLGEKLMLVRAALPKLSGVPSVRGGVLDVSSVANADFRPAATPTPVPSPTPAPTPEA